MDTSIATTMRPEVWKDLDTDRYERLGTGSWDAWGPELGPLEDAIEDWKQQLAGIDKPWLCWCVSDRFCRIQQRIVAEFGWTPVVSGDPRAESPTVLPGSVPLDVNRLLKLPTIWHVFVPEFTYAIAPRLAFWHADLLVSRRHMEYLVRIIDNLKEGESAACRHRGWWLNTTQACPALVAATTREASRDQWRCGCSWWRWFSKHPNFRDDYACNEHTWDTGRGIWYWARNHDGPVKRIVPDETGHCRMPWQKWKGRMSKAESMIADNDVDAVVRKLGIEDLDDRDLPASP